LQNVFQQDRPELESYVDRIVALGGEGAMVRQPGSRYVGSRSNTLFKVKRFSDEEVTVIGHEPGKGKYVGMLGAIKIQLKSGLTCSVGSGFTDDDRRNPPKIGATVTIKYQELTPAGIPRFPIFIGERID
jgi:DNA ligase-1